MQTSKSHPKPPNHQRNRSRPKNERESRTSAVQRRTPSPAGVSSTRSCCGNDPVFASVTTRMSPALTVSRTTKLRPSPPETETQAWLPAAHSVPEDVDRACHQITRVNQHAWGEYQACDGHEHYTDHRSRRHSFHLRLARRSEVKFTESSWASRGPMGGHKAPAGWPSLHEPAGSIPTFFFRI